MDVQLLLVGLIVAAAAGYLLRRAWRSWRASGRGCAGGCGCGKAVSAARADFIPSEQLTLRRR